MSLRSEILNIYIVVCVVSEVTKVHVTMISDYDEDGKEYHNYFLRCWNRSLVVPRLVCSTM